MLKRGVATFLADQFVSPVLMPFHLPKPAAVPEKTHTPLLLKLCSGRVVTAGCVLPRLLTAVPEPGRMWGVECGTGEDRRLRAGLTGPTAEKQVI